MSAMRISQLAARCGVPATTLRYYESAGLLPADRTPAGYRVYGEDAVERLAFIGAAKHLGLPLDEIRELLALWEGGACREVKAELRPRIAARLEEAERRVAELTAFTTSLNSALDHLDALPDRAEPCDPRCGFLARPRRSTSTPVDVTLSPIPTTPPHQRDP
ncbi:MerR family transcriptional regulator [Streptomyces sp. NPDC051662]|uniref:MerR family transcriptional regulator n=1 Tax=Streptomyces sp. NPDC051662 TaxID=3154750 RepID=UPI0034171081